MTWASSNPSICATKAACSTSPCPPAEVFIATLDNQKSYVYDRETGIFTKGVNDLETLARQAAEQEILKAAMEDGILN